MSLEVSEDLSWEFDSVMPSKLLSLTSPELSCTVSSIIKLLAVLIIIKTKVNSG